MSEDKDTLLSTVQCLPQRYREIMMRSSCPDSQELKISRHPNETAHESQHVAPPGVGGPVMGYGMLDTPHLRLEPLSDLLSKVLSVSESALQHVL